MFNLTRRNLLSLALLSTLFFNTAAFSTAVFAAAAPPFTLPTETDSVSLAKLSGKVVYLDFWASWCAPCRKSFPWMQELQSRYKDKGLVVIAVNLDKNNDKAKEFLKQFPNDFIVAFDPDGKVAEQYKVMGMPSSYLIDPKGQIYFSHIGFREADTDQLETQIRKLLKQ